MKLKFNDYIPAEREIYFKLTNVMFSSNHSYFFFNFTQVVEIIILRPLPTVLTV